MEARTLIMCFQADGPYWSDLLYIPAYPSGFTYQKWQFRYRTQWLHKDVQVKLEEWSRDGNGLELPTIVAARFKTGHLQRILPLRKATVTRAFHEAGVNNFYFRLDSLRDFRGISGLDESCLDLLQGEWSPEPDSNPLMFYSEIDVVTLKWSEPKDESDSWAHLVDLIGDSTKVPLHKNVQSSTFTRLSLPKGKHGTAPVKALFTDAIRGKIYGAELKEGSAYTFTVTHRIPSGSRGDTRPTIEFQYQVASRNIELSQPTAEVIGFQQTTPIGIGAIVPSATWDELVIKGTTVSSPDDKNQHESANRAEFAIPIPLLVHSSWTYRFRSRWIWNVILFFALIIQGAASFLHDALSKFLEGKAELSDLFYYWQAWLVILVSSAAATIAITGIQGRTKLK